MITIRRLALPDACYVWKLAGKFIKHIIKKSLGVTDEQKIKSNLRAFKDWSYGMFEGDELIGVLAGGVTTLFLINEPVWYEALFYIKRSKRNLAVKFINEVRQDLKKRGVVYMTLGVAEPSKGVRHLYKKIGYHFLDGHYISKL